MSVFSHKNILDFLFYFTIKNLFTAAAAHILRARLRPTTAAALRNRVSNKACADVAYRFQPSKTPLAHNLDCSHFLTWKNGITRFPYIFI